MFTVYHYPLCPFSRIVRLVLSEKQVPFELVIEPFWERRVEFLRMNPSGQTPVLIDDRKAFIIPGCWAILEYLDEIIPESILGNAPEQRAYVRYITDWFCCKFHHEVGRHLFREKIVNVLSNRGPLSSESIRVAKRNLQYHLDYIAYLLGESYYFAGDKPTLADYAAAAHISTLDYTGDMPWDYSARVKEWYSLLKSRPSFRQILQDEVKGIIAPRYYQNPDF